MKYLHTMVRVHDLEAALGFYCDVLGLVEIERNDYEDGQYTLVFLAAPEDAGRAAEQRAPLIELTYNWDGEVYQGGRNFGHLAFAVDDVYAVCQRALDAGIPINVPPRDGHMAFFRSPDKISVELLQKGDPLPPAEPWVSMPTTGEW